MSKTALAVVFGLALSLSMMQPNTYAQDSAPAASTQAAPNMPQGWQTRRHGFKFNTNNLNQPAATAPAPATATTAAAAAGAPKKKVEEPSLVCESPANRTCTKAGWQKF